MRLLDEGAIFYVCGWAAMAREVSKSLTSFLIESKGWTDDEVQMCNMSLRRKGNWKEDVWG
jgi:NADPH-ferrihemoprotein reductase